MRSCFEFNPSYAHARPPIFHTSPYLEYVFASPSGRSHAKRCMYRVVGHFYKRLYHIDESVSVLISKVSVQFILECSMSPFHECAFHVGVLANVELNAFTLQHSLKRSFQNSLSTIRLHPDRLPGYEFLVFRFVKNLLKRWRERLSRIRFQRHDMKIFWKVVLAVNKYFIPSLYLLLHVNQITFQNVRNIIHGVRIARKSLSNGAMWIVSILCLEPCSQSPAVFPIAAACSRF